MGLRWERQTFTNATLNFAPRMGFVYDVFGTNNTIFRAGYRSISRRSSTPPSPAMLLASPAASSPTPPPLVRSASLRASPRLHCRNFPQAALCQCAALYVRPGQSAYLAQWFPTSALNG
jgi:hypothetical protein